MRFDIRIRRDAAVQADGGEPPGAARVELSPRNVWQVGWVVICLVAIALFARFVLDDGGATIFTVLMAWFGALAVEPAMAPLARHMKRGFAAMIILAAIAVLTVLFVLAFGRLILEQLVQLAEHLPALAATVTENVSAWADIGDPQATVPASGDPASAVVSDILMSVVRAAATVVGSVLGLFTFGLFFFYFCADGPRLRSWLLTLAPHRVRGVFATMYDTTAEKTGHYVAARVVLATINSATSAVVFVLIGMPYWLALAVWTGVVAQFVPTIGTYISIILPVVVGLLSGDPWIGVAALVWALIYQQVENLTIEPKISARAVDVHPAVAFGSVMLGAALFGVAGALLAIPVVAMILSLLEGYRTKYAT